MILLESGGLAMVGTDEGVAKVTVLSYHPMQELSWYEVRELYAGLNEWLLENAHLAGERK